GTLLSLTSRRDDHETHDMSEPAFANTGDWQRHFIEDMRGVRRVLEETRRIAVLGIKIEESGAPAFYVPEYVQHAGYEIVPVPVYYPECTAILGEKVYRTVAEIPGPIDMVNVFRRPHRIP